MLMVLDALLSMVLSNDHCVVRRRRRCNGRRRGFPPKQCAERYVLIDRCDESDER